MKDEDGISELGDVIDEVVDRIIGRAQAAEKAREASGGPIYRGTRHEPPRREARPLPGPTDEFDRQD